MAARVPLGRIDPWKRRNSGAYGADWQNATG
jgi:hypothetical protein